VINPNEDARLAPRPGDLGAAISLSALAGRQVLGETASLKIGRPGQFDGASGGVGFLIFYLGV
jgi:hypothetical protein